MSLRKFQATDLIVRKRKREGNEIGMGYEAEVAV